MFVALISTLAIIAFLLKLLFGRRLRDHYFEKQRPIKETTTTATTLPTNSNNDNSHSKIFIRL